MPKRANPRVPHTPDEVAADGIRCIVAGASILHNHTRDPVIGGSGIHDPAPYREAWSQIRDRYPNAIFYPTMRSRNRRLYAYLRKGFTDSSPDWGLGIRYTYRY